MYADANSIDEEFWFGDVDGANRGAWLSPAILGFGAPMLLGLLIAPGLFSRSAVVIAIGLVALLALAIILYAMSVLAPGTPATLKVLPDDRCLKIVRRGLFGNTEVSVPFADVARVDLTHGTDRDLEPDIFISIKTRNADVWAVPASVDADDIGYLRAVIGLRPR